MQDSCPMTQRRPFSSHRILAALLLCLACAAAGMAHAERADRDKPMNIEADSLRHDELQQTTVFTGRVVMTKGTIVLRGARLEVRQTPEGYQAATVTAEAGQRAFFRQKRDVAAGQPEEYVEGEGETIEYDGRSDTVKLRQRAQLRRYRGALLGDEINGSTITYNNLTDHFAVDSAATARNDGAGDAPAGARVRAVLVPKEAAPLSTQPLPGVAPVLRPSSATQGAQP